MMTAPYARFSSQQLIQVATPILAATVAKDGLPPTGSYALDRTEQAIAMARDLILEANDAALRESDRATRKKMSERKRS